MLIITRVLDEKIIINDDIVIEVLGIKGRQVRLGIQAPENVAINREEVYNALQAEKENAKD